ncbi:major capsid protein [Microviridae sp.]|nr:major capsid protein [Microviridae sp.]
MTYSPRRATQMARRNRRKGSRNRSVMTHQFSQVPKAEIQRSSFDRSHGRKTTVNAGYLVPIFVDEVLPGDTFNVRANLFGRLATPLKPIMDNIFLDTFFFFVPNRLVWDNWEKFCGSQDNPADSTDYSIPTFTLGQFGEGGLGDYMGLPIGKDIAPNCLPFRAYNLIWAEWFRDQNLQDSPVLNTDDGPDSSGYSLLRRGKRHDYFTSCLPWPQKGDAVTVDLAGFAPVGPRGTGVGDSVSVTDLDDGTDYLLNSSGANLLIGNAQTAENLWADLQQATGFTINDLRQSFQIQRLLERDARGGTRYAEVIRSHFGVVSPDMRLGRPEFLGGGSQMVNINPVPQTAPKDETVGTVQGNLAATGTVSASGHGFTKSFTEHGYIIGLVNFRADLTYQQGLNRMWSRSTRYDFYWPALAHLGEQAVLNKEIYTQGDANDDLVFGYQERYAEYRYKPSEITAEFRSAAAASLDVWHLSQDFGSLPVLGDTFIQDNPPIDRVIAVQEEPHFLLDCYFNMRCARPMPLYGVPGLIDHF